MLLNGFSPQPAFVRSNPRGQVQPLTSTGFLFQRGGGSYGSEFMLQRIAISTNIREVNECRCHLSGFQTGLEGAPHQNRSSLTK
jgi:hypothetical protein